MGYDGINGRLGMLSRPKDRLQVNTNKVVKPNQVGYSKLSTLRKNIIKSFRDTVSTKYANKVTTAYTDNTKEAVKLPPEITFKNIVIALLAAIYRFFKFIGKIFRYLFLLLRLKEQKFSTTKQDVKDIKKTFEGGAGAGAGASGVRWPKALFALSIFPNVFTVILVICLIILLVWVIIQTFIRWITFDYVKLPDIPIAVDRKITQIAYSIFFVILSCYLMFYLLLDYLLNIKDELDIIQILKQFIASAYILWPIAGLIIGSAIAKAFYKMACKGAKTNILNFAKIVESTALFIFGIVLAIKIVLLIRPLTKMLKSGPKIVTTMLDYVSSKLSIIMKAIVIYILLRMVTLFIEDVISNNIVFFVSKLSKNIEPPPGNCNAEEKKLKKQSEIGAVMIKVYRYIAMILILILIVFIVVIQCPHPWMGSFINLNNSIGLMIKRMLNVLTKYIGENDFGKNNVNKDRKGVGSLLNTLGQGLGQAQGQGQGVGEGLGLGQGVGEGLGLGQGVGEGLGLGQGVGEGLGLGQGVGEGLEEGVGQGKGEGVGQGKGEGVGEGKVIKEKIGEEKIEIVKKPTLISRIKGVGARLVNEFDKMAETNALTLTNNKRNENIRYGDITEQDIAPKVSENDKRREAVERRSLSERVSGFGHQAEAEAWLKPTQAPETAPAQSAPAQSAPAQSAPAQSAPSTGEVTGTKNERGTTPAHQTHHPNDTPTIEEVLERRHFPNSKKVARI
jgi:hypothetical protein